MLPYLIFIIIGYFAGSVNPAIILSKLKGKDIRSLGSKNAGATNTLRNFGKKAALIVTLCDILKCVIAVFVARALSGFFDKDVLITSILSATGCILGHNFPIYFGFKGGKGVLVSVTALFVIDYRVGIAALITFIVFFAITKYVSLGSVLGAVVAILVSAFLGNTMILIFTAFAGILTIIRHKKNIERLIKGTESKTSFGKKKE